MRKYLYILCILITVQIHAATKTWDGGGADDNWTTAANWDLDVAPVAGDILIFTGIVRPSPINNFPAGTTFTSIQLTGIIGSCTNFALSGNDFILSGGATAIVNDAGTAGLGGYTLTINNNIQFSTVAPTISLTNTTNNKITINGNIDNGGLMLSVDNIGNAGNITIVGIISGAGGLTKSNTGIIVLDGINTYTGGTILNNGTIRVSNPSALGSTSGTITINGGSLNSVPVTTLNDYPMIWNSNFGIWGSNINFGNGPITLNTDITINVDVSRLLSVGGIISGDYSLTKTGLGTLYLSGLNTFGKTTTISAGTIRLGSSTALGSIAFGTVVDAGGVLDLYGQDYTSNEPLTINTTASGAIINSVATAGTYAGIITLGSSSYINASVGDISLTNNGNITGTFDLLFGGPANGTCRGLITINTGTVTKQNTGTWTLTRNNSYTGATSITAGTLVLQSGYRSVSYTIASSATLELNRNSDIDYTFSTSFLGAGTIRKTGTGSVSWGTSVATFSLTSGSLIDVQAGEFIADVNNNEDWTNNYSNVTVSAGAKFNTGTQSTVIVNALNGAGSVIVGTTTGVGKLTIGVDNGSGTFIGIISDYAVANIGTIDKIGSGTQILSGANTYSGETIISSGTIQLGNSNVIPDVGNVTVNGILNINGFDETVGSISGNGFIDNLTGAGTPTFTFGVNNATTTFAGVIKNTTGLLNVTKSGTGTIYFDGNNTYYGQTYVENGNVELRLGSVNSN